MPIILLILLFSFFIHSEVCAKDLFSREDLKRFAYYKSRDYFADKKSRELKRRSQTFFAQLLKFQQKSLKNRNIDQLRKVLWKKIDIFNDRQMRNSLIMKFLHEVPDG